MLPGNALPVDEARNGNDFEGQGATDCVVPNGSEPAGMKGEAMSTENREQRIRRALYTMTLLDFVTILLRNEQLEADNAKLKAELAAKQETK